MKLIALLGFSVLLTVVSIPVMGWISRRLTLLRRNFKGDEVPTSFGFILLLAGVPAYCLAWHWQLIELAPAYIAAIVGFGLLGLADDIWGCREVGGFKGHIRLLLKKGRVSTGLIKAFGGGVLSLALGAWISGGNLPMTLLYGLTISLSANTINLLDLRPGRAVSCYWFGIIALGIIGGFSMVLALLPILAPALWLTIYDRRAKIMMGDAGSNILGACLGLAIISTALTYHICILLILLIVNIISERYSITKIIESNGLLRRVDRLLGER